MLNFINEYISSPIMVCGAIIVGIYLTFKMRFVQVTHFFDSFKSLFENDKKKSGISPFQAVTTALSGTLGTGNIVGVATAISIGGAGSLFWMWVSAFFGMATKFCEISTSVLYSQKDNKGNFFGGPMYYIKNPKLQIAFAIFCLLSSFGIGNMVQSNTVAEAVSCTFNINFKPIIIIIMILVFFTLVGGIKRIASITEKAIPFMATFYIGGCLLVICMNLPSICSVFQDIISSAFDFSSIGGGLIGYKVVRSMKIGITRGIFTNEAGLGSAPIAHACANAKSPSKQGFLGVFEVFFDTIVMCTMTGIVILLSSKYSANIGGNVTGANLTLGAFEEFLGSFAGSFIAISTIFFAVSTIISWSYYGSACVTFLTKSKTAQFVYRICYIIAIYIGATSTLNFVFAFSDLLNCLMMIPNLIGICAISNEVKKSLLDEFPKINSNNS